VAGARLTNGSGIVLCLGSLIYRVVCRQHVQEVRRECEYDSELAAVRLEKVQRYFLGNVEVEALEVTGIRAAGVKVSCFRTTKLSPETHAMLREIHDMINTQRCGQPSLSLCSACYAVRVNGWSLHAPPLPSP
jgi:hypothetical protein